MELSLHHFPEGFGNERGTGTDKDGGSVREELSLVHFLAGELPTSPDSGSLDSLHELVVLAKAAVVPCVRFGDWATELLGSCNPKVDNGFCVDDSFLPRRSVSCTPGQIRHFGDERIIFVAPVQDDFVAGHRFQRPTRELSSRRRLTGEPSGVLSVSRPVRGVCERIDLQATPLSASWLAIPQQPDPISRSFRICAPEP